MTIYHFAVRNDAGDKEDLGNIDLVNDKDANTFAASVIEDLTYEYAPQYSGSVMEITDQKRIVARLEFR